MAATGRDLTVAAVRSVDGYPEGSFHYRRHRDGHESRTVFWWDPRIHQLLCTVLQADCNGRDTGISAPQQRKLDTATTAHVGKLWAVHASIGATAVPPGTRQALVDAAGIDADATATGLGAAPSPDRSDHGAVETEPGQ